MKENYSFEELLEIIARLRSENGCPWDKVQTHKSLRKYIIEEAYETVDAIDSGVPTKLADELGDVLLQVLLHSEIGREKNEFSIEDVINFISKKMITRHPHVFAEEVCETPEEVLQNWEAIKKKEKKLETLTDTLKDIPAHFPALMKSEKVASKLYKNETIKLTARDITEIAEKQLDRLKQNLKSGNEAETAKSLGSLLFLLSALSYRLNISSEIALNEATVRVVNMFEEKENAGKETEFEEMLKNM